MYISGHEIQWKSRSFPAQCRSSLSSSVSPASFLVLKVSRALWTWFWPLWCLSVPTFKFITSPSPARQQPQSVRMGTALGPIPHTCSRSHTRVGKVLFPQQRKAQAQSCPSFWTFTSHSCCCLPGRVTAKVLCHCISESFCFLRPQ